MLETATEIAARFDARMFLFRAITVPQEFPAAAAAHAAPRDALAEVMAVEAMNDLAMLAAGNPRAIVEAPVVGHGDPWRAIVEAGDRLGVDLTVVGSHLYYWPDRILGTVAANLANRGHRNVLIIRV